MRQRRCARSVRYTDGELAAKKPFRITKDSYIDYQDQARLMW